MSNLHEIKVHAHKMREHKLWTHKIKLSINQINVCQISIFSGINHLSHFHGHGLHEFSASDFGDFVSSFGDILVQFIPIFALCVCFSCLLIIAQRFCSLIIAQWATSSVTDGPGPRRCNCYL